LDWEEPQKEYPRFFDMESMTADKIHLWYFTRGQLPEPSDMEELIGKLSHTFNNVFYTSPVSSREFFSWVPIFDIAARKMTEEQFRRSKSACAFMAYVHMDENLMPTHKMLASHPNFLADIKSVPGLMAGLFPNHPHSRHWLEHFERSMALNLKYHTRPEVKCWEANAGRWTENLGCYVWAALEPMLKTASLDG